MSLTAGALKKAASNVQAEIAARVAGPQGGVPTFFDNFFNGVLARLIANERLHGWNPGLQTMPGTPASFAAEELQWLARLLERRKQGRLVPYAVRRADDAGGPDSEVGDMALLMSQGTAACLDWKGSPLFKTVFDFAIVPMLLWELKPASIFEIGSGSGASACWMADLLKGFGLDSQIYSVDIKPVVRSDPGVRFLAGDCRSPATLFDAELLGSAPRPRLLIEDAHINVHDVLVHMDQFLNKGDYLYVEDSRGKEADLTRFTVARAHRYKVDTRYTDFFGRNATCAASSILVRV